MNWFWEHFNVVIIFGLLSTKPINAGITRQQFEQSMEMMRNGCQPKFKVSTEVLDDLRIGQFQMGNKDLMCYTKCIAQLAGTMTKKGEFSITKALAQIPIILPPELQGPAKEALSHCKDVQKAFPDSCEKVFETTRCIANYDSVNFYFP